MLFDVFEARKRGFNATQEFLKERITRKFNWKPKHSVEYFESPYSSSLTDSIQDLRRAIAATVVPGEIVLTTPRQAIYFEEVGVKQLAVYDISQAQLLESNRIEKVYWCDVFNMSLLKSLLILAKPTLIYLSNILERTWGQDMKSVEDVADRLSNFSYLKNIMFSGIMDNSLVSREFLSMLQSRGWSSQEFMHSADERTPRVFSARR